MRPSTVNTLPRFYMRRSLLSRRSPRSLLPRRSPRHSRTPPSLPHFTVADAVRKVLFGEGAAAAGKCLRYEGIKDGAAGGERFPIEDDEVPMDTDWVAVFVDDAGAVGSGGSRGARTAAAGGAAGEEKEAEAAAMLRSTSAVRRAGVVDRLTVGTSLKSVADAVSASEVVTALTLIALAVRAIPPTINIAKMDLITTVKEWRNEHTGALPNLWRETMVRVQPLS